MHYIVKAACSLNQRVWFGRLGKHETTYLFKKSSNTILSCECEFDDTLSGFYTSDGQALTIYPDEAGVDQSSAIRCIGVTYKKIKVFTKSFSPLSWHKDLDYQSLSELLYIDGYERVVF